METFDLLKQLTEAPGPTGKEEGAAAVIEPLWRPLVDEIVADRVGSLPNGAATPQHFACRPPG
ncbi:MAG TPA: hypothetical protein PLR07_08970 [Promineifilum sp.]|nr:hypothetical protein [Promineifilum sp.]